MKKNRVNGWWWCLPFVFNFFTTAQGQDSFEPPAQAPSFRAVEIFNPITLDGKLIEPEWAQAETVRDFFRMEPRQGGNIFTKPM